jgi:heparan-alpha-glucosaminide N-acetyltransferase
MSTAIAPSMPASSQADVPARPARVTSIDALRGFVMLAMIFVNDLAGGGKIVPDWMVHFSDRHKRGSGMTFVDLVFPGFLFIVGMSIPFALGPRLSRGESVWKILGHVVVRTLSLLLLGIMMVNGESLSPDVMSGRPELWAYLMFASAIFAFCSISPHRKGTEGATGDTKARVYKGITIVVRVIAFASLVWLAFQYRGRRGQHIVTLSPFSIHTSWYGILGLIGWSYLVGSIVFLCFRNHRTALLGCLVLLLSLYPADKKGLFDDFWLSKFMGISEMLGAHPSITVGGLLLASILTATDLALLSAKVRFTVLFAAAAAAGAILLNGLYGISKNEATPSWCLWSCAITALLWLGFYYVCDVRPVKWIARPFAIAGQNVLLAYLLSEMLPNFLKYGGWGEDNLGCVIGQSVAWAVVLLAFTAALNRVGFRLRL